MLMLRICKNSHFVYVNGRDNVLYQLVILLYYDVKISTSYADSKSYTLLSDGFKAELRLA